MTDLFSIYVFHLGLAFFFRVNNKNKKNEKKMSEEGETIKSNR